MAADWRRNITGYHRKDFSMSFNKRKRRTSERHELQLPIERRQHIQSLFEKKFTYRKPLDNSWKLPQSMLEMAEVLPFDTKNRYSQQHAQVTENQSDSSYQPCDSNMDQSDEFDKASVQLTSQKKVLNKLWTVDEFIKMKTELNKLKNNLNDKDMISWHMHTRSVNLASNISIEIGQSFRPELCTQAWCKFYEIASTYLGLQKDSMFSVHLCEAPGAFLTSLNHFMLSQGYEGHWDWLATTLNPYYEGNAIGQMINDDRFIRHTQRSWYFGADNTGDLMSLRNLEGLKKMIDNKEVNLVTADGSIDCQGVPAEQEDVVSRLQHCEALTALQILSPGGDFVLKMFTLLECKAISLMYLLNCVFEEVHVFKPCMSKGGNSEVYLVCLRFKGMEDPEYLRQLSLIYFGDTEPQGCLFSKTQIPSSFLTQHSECTSFFKELQMASIQRNLDLYKKMSEEEIQILEVEKQFCSECFFERYYIVPMVNQWRIMKYKKKQQNPHTSTAKVSTFEKFASSRKNEGHFCGSFDDRQQLSLLPWKQRIKEYETYNISEEDLIWAENPNSARTVTKDVRFHVTWGRQVEKIKSSRFCYGRLIQQTQEIIQNVEWLLRGDKMNKDTISTIIEKLMSILASLSRDVTDLGRDEHTTKQLQKHTNTASKTTTTGDQVNKLGTEHSNGRIPENSSNSLESNIDHNGSVTLVKNAAAVSSHVLSGLIDQFNRSASQFSNSSVEVQLYNVCGDCLDEKFELKEQTELSFAVRNIIETCHSGGVVIIEMRSCLTRMTAGLVYILFRFFRKIGFLSHPDSLLKQHLVCLDFCLQTRGLSELRDYVQEVCTADDSNTEFSKLELVPVSILIEDAEFCSFLQTSNTRLLQSFVTSVVEKERTLLSGNSDLT